MLEGGRSPTAALQPRPSCAIIGRRRTRTCTCIWLGPLPPIGQGTRGAQSPPSPEVDHQQATHHTLPSPVLLSFPFPSVLRPQLFISQAHQLFSPSCHRLLHPKTDTPSLSVSSGPVVAAPSSVLRASHVCVDSFHSRSVPAATVSLLSSRATPFSDPFVGSFIPSCVSSAGPTH